MKRNILYIAMACMTLFASCKKEINQVLPEAVEMEFGATVDDNGSKTYLSGTSVLWADGDQISVNGTAIDLVAGAGYKYGTFRGKVTPYDTDKFYVGYPASATTFNTSTGEMSVTIPSVQTHNATETLLGQLPMAAYAEGTGNKMTLHFKNAVNILKLNLWSSTATTVKSIVVSSSSAPLCGTIPVNVSAGEISFGNMTSTGNTITMNCATAVNVSTDENNPTPFYFFIPKIEANTVLTIRIYDSSHNYQELHITVNGDHNNSLMTSVNQLIAGSQTYSPDAEPYVAFGEMVKYGDYTANVVEYVENDNVTVSCVMKSGVYEKLAFPIYNLEVDEWYTITFGEYATRLSGSGTFWETVGSYATSVRASEEYDTNSGYGASLPNTSSDGLYHVWVHSPGVFANNDYTPTSEASTIFLASASTMYWLWDLGKLDDGGNFSLKFSLSGTRIQKIERSNVVPRVDLVNCNMRYYTFKNGLSEENGKKNLLSYKIYADNQRLEMQIIPKSGSNYEKINIPIVNLSIGQNYRLTFDYHRTFHGTGSELDSDTYDLCFGVAQNEVTANSSTALHNTSNTSSDTDYYTYTDNIPDRDITGQTIEFTAKATMMYWVWSQSKILGGKRCTQCVENVTLEEITTK